MNEYAAWYWELFMVGGWGVGTDGRGCTTHAYRVGDPNAISALLIAVNEKRRLRACQRGGGEARNGKWGEESSDGTVRAGEVKDHSFTIGDTHVSDKWNEPVRQTSVNMYDATPPREGIAAMKMRLSCTM